MIVLAPVRLVAGGASLLKRGLVMVRLLRRVGNVAVASETNIDGIRFWQSGLAAGMWAVTVCAIARCAGMRNFRGIDQFGFIVVARDAQCLGVWLR